MALAALFLDGRSRVYLCRLARSPATATIWTLSASVAVIALGIDAWQHSSLKAS